MADPYLQTKVNGKKYKRDNRIENLEIVTADAHAKEHLSKYPTTKECVICKDSFTPHKTKRRRNQTCSDGCKRKLISARLLEISKSKRPLKD